MELLLKPANGMVLLEIPKVTSNILTPTNNSKGVIEAAQSKGDGVKIIGVSETSMYSVGDYVFFSGDYARVSAKFRNAQGTIVREDVYLLAEGSISAYYEAGTI